MLTSVTRRMKDFSLNQAGIMKIMLTGNPKLIKHGNPVGNFLKKNLYRLSPMPYGRGSRDAIDTHSEMVSSLLRE